MRRNIFGRLTVLLFVVGFLCAGASSAFAHSSSRTKAAIQPFETVTTQLSAPITTVGTGVHDTATLSGLTGTKFNGDTVTYTVYGSIANCLSDTSGIDEGTVSAFGNGPVASSNTFTPTSTGTYYWRASFNGADGTNAPVSSDCSTEPMTVTEGNTPPGNGPPPGSPTVRISFAYADSFRPAGIAGLPSPWQGSSGVIFVGCGGGGGVASNGDECPTKDGRDLYDGGAIMITNTSATASVVVKHARVRGGALDCSYKPWPGLDVTIPPGGSLILTQTGLSGDPCGQDLGGNYNFDTSESNGNGQCHPTSAVLTVIANINGNRVKIDDTAQILNTGGLDPGGCTVLLDDEFHQWWTVADQ